MSRTSHTPPVPLNNLSHRLYLAVSSYSTPHRSLFAFAGCSRLLNVARPAPAPGALPTL